MGIAMQFRPGMAGIAAAAAAAAPAAPAAASTAPAAAAPPAAVPAPGFGRFCPDADAIRAAARVGAASVSWASAVGPSINCPTRHMLLLSSRTEDSICVSMTWRAKYDEPLPRGAAHLNGAEGVVVRSDPAKSDRIIVRLREGAEVSVKVTNCTRLGG